MAEISTALLGLVIASLPEGPARVEELHTLLPTTPPFFCSPWMVPTLEAIVSFVAAAAHDGRLASARLEGLRALVGLAYFLDAADVLRLTEAIVDSVSALLVAHVAARWAQVRARPVEICELLRRTLERRAASASVSDEAFLALVRLI